MSHHQQPRAHDAIAGKRVLIIEDEIIFALDLQEKLEDAGGIVVGPISTLEDALIVAERENVDAAIVDVDLHGVESFPAADILKRKGIPFLWHTGVVQRETFSRDYPDVPVLEKPTRLNDVLDVVVDLTADASA